MRLNANKSYAKKLGDKGNPMRTIPYIKKLTGTFGSLSQHITLQLPWKHILSWYKQFYYTGTFRDD